MKSIFRIDPLLDARWPALLLRSPHASLFHSPQWLGALHSTYGYLPVAYTTSPPGSPLENGWVFCEIRSWLTGRRLVSLPFSDHCDPLLDNLADFGGFACTLMETWRREDWDYVEFRPQCGLQGNAHGFQLREPFYLHKLDLSPPLDQIFCSLDRNCIQRKIRRAERDALGYEEGNSESLISRFYSLFTRTRQRHSLPPQPRGWFTNLVASFRDQLMIHLASKDGKPVGAMLMLHFKNVLVFKYSCGEPEHFKHGTMQLLLWRAIQNAKAKGLDELDFGRSDWGDSGLIQYKERWGATRFETGYLRYSPVHSARRRWFSAVGKQSSIPSHIPERVLQAAGRLLYRHFG
jgi:hypothetical protein